MKTSRRKFLSSAAAVSAGFLGLERFVEAAVGRESRNNAPSKPAQLLYQNQIERYGPLRPDPQRIFDLPEGFRYTILSQTGDGMSDGLRVPGAPDGMAAFPGPDGKIVLVRNHEVTSEMAFDGPFGIDRRLMSKIDCGRMYDAGEGVRPHLGGTTTLLYNPATQRVEKQFLSLGGTCRNCAGGPTPWNSWVSCEETVEVSWESEKKTRARRKVQADDESRDDEPQERKNFNEKNHGYTFEVPADPSSGLVSAVPLVAMGRFNHEAIAVDPASGVVFQTEDRDDGLIYRFIPNEPGKLARGGKLQALAIKGHKSVDTRNWPETGKPKLTINALMPVEWIDLSNIDSPKDDLRKRGYKNGAARFARGEGMWYGQNEVFFACTNGGIGKVGQVFRYQPSAYEGTSREIEHPGQLALYLEPNNTFLIQSCDNLTVAPWGDLIICEDGAEHNYLRGVTRDGKIYTIGDSVYHTRSELCGACFAPHQPILFVNLQRPGLTLAITGPWIPS